MKKRFTEAQIIGFLPEAEAGLQVKDLCRRHGFSEASYYLWRRCCFDPDFRFRCGTVTHRISSRALIARVPT